jgi:hypothetical protein
MTCINGIWIGFQMLMGAHIDLWDVILVIRDDPDSSGI